MAEYGNLSIKQWAVEDRPREKLLTKGIRSLSDAELLAILIGSGTREASAVDLAKKILRASGHNLNDLSRMSVHDLRKFKGIGEARAIAIVAAMEERRAWANLVVDLFALIEETYEHGLNQPLASEQLFTMLFTRLRGVRYSRSQITAMLEFLTHPAIRAMIGDPETGVTLAMSQSTLVRVLRSLADLIETTEPETYE